MDFLQYQKEICEIAKKIDKDGYDSGASGGLGYFTVESITSDEICFNWKQDIDDGEKVPTIIIKNTNNPNYPVDVWYASKNSLNTINGYLLLTIPSIITPCKTLRKVLLQVRDFLFQ